MNPNRDAIRARSGRGMHAKLHKFGLTAKDVQRPGHTGLFSCVLDIAPDGLTVSAIMYVADPVLTSAISVPRAISSAPLLTPYAASRHPPVNVIRKAQNLLLFI